MRDFVETLLDTIVAIPEDSISGKELSRRLMVLCRDARYKPNEACADLWDRAGRHVDIALSGIDQPWKEDVLEAFTGRARSITRELFDSVNGKES